MSEHVELLQDINSKLSALLAISVDQYLRSTPELADPRPRPIDRILTDAGLSTRQVAELLGKSRQAVEQMLEKKTARPGAVSDSSARRMKGQSR